MSELNENIRPGSSELNEQNCRTILLTNNEEEVGVTEFILPDNQGFQGLIKKRFSDFIVNEIKSSGEVVHLDNEEFESSLNSLKASKKLKELHTDDSSSSNVGIIVDPEIKSETIKEILKEQPKEIEESFYFDLNEFFKCDKWEEIVEQLKELVDTKGKSNSSGLVIPVAIEDKKHRSEMHQFVREKALGLLDTMTLDGGKIKFKYSPKRQTNKRKSRDSVRQLPFLHFTLYKENRDTMDAINFICKVLQTNVKHFGFAGTKDKRGITTQRVSVQRVDHQRLSGLNRTLRNMKLSSFSYHPEPLRLGDLGGNFFTVTIRNLALAGSADIQQDINNTLLKFSRSPGFVNYYGMQRFGTNSIPTHHVGLALLKSDWASAVDLILGPRPGDVPEVNEARELWKQTNDAEKCLPLFPSYLVAERAILSTFAKVNDTRNCLEAIKRIPRSLRLLYVHAYQSCVWNKAVSIRIKTLGISPVLGDLVKNGSSVRPLNEEELSSTLISDVVFPLPGHSIKYPNYSSLGDLYLSIMSKDGLDPNDMIRRESDYSLPGDYRNCIALPKDFSWSFTRYSDPEGSLDFLDDTLSKDSSELLAVQLKFSLPASSYATMLLREIMKVRTEKAFMTMA